MQTYSTFLVYEVGGAAAVRRVCESWPDRRTTRLELISCGDTRTLQSDGRLRPPRAVDVQPRVTDTTVDGRSSPTNSTDDRQAAGRCRTGTGPASGDSRPVERWTDERWT